MASANLTPRELEILVAFVTETKTDVDWDKVANKANCNTAKYARDKFALIRNKLIASLEGVQGDANGAATNGTTNGGTPKTKPAKKTPVSKRKKAEDNKDDEEETPTKKAKPTARKSASKSKSATPGETKVTPPAEMNENEDPEIKPEPNEAGELMDELVGTD